MGAIWITGGKGFIGRYVARFAATQNYSVFGIGHGLWPVEDARRWSYSHWANGEIESANLSQLANISGSPDTIFHLAGGSSVGASFQSPHEDFCRTVETTGRLLEWVRLNAPAARVVSVSSAAVYGAGHAGRIAEDVKITPYSPYGFHKSIMESVCRSYCENFGLRAAVVRLFSVYGAGLEKQLIWDLCSKLTNSGSRPVSLGGTGNEMRDWLHVTDAARLLWLARDECSVGGNAINGGSGVGTSTSDIARLVCRAWSESARVEFSGHVRRGDPPSLVADVTRAFGLGFRPAVELQSGIGETVEWFRDHRSRSSGA